MSNNTSATTRISYIILILVITTMMFMVYGKVGNTDMSYVKSDIDGNNYLVRNRTDNKKVANLLASIKADIMDISEYLSRKLESKNESDQKKYQPQKQYINQLKRNLKNVEIKESASDTEYTSYTVNKGETIVFCVRSKSITNYIKSHNIHDKNLVMYVALHEISHVACPEYGHTDLFKRIFKFICETGIELGIYKKVDFESNPIEYCGMKITDSIV
jgi:hypothetical protein